MAIEYVLELTGADVDNVAHLLTRTATNAGLVDQAGGEPNVGGTGDWLDSGVFLRAVANPPLPFRDPIEKKLGIAPTTSVLFRFTTADDPVRQTHDMVRLVSVLLTEIRGDAALLFNGDVVWLLRKGGQLTISNEDDFWEPDLQALLPQPFDRASLPVL